MKVTTEAELRQFIPAANEAVQAKKSKSLDEQATGFIQRSPFVVISTADANGRITASPKGDHAGFVAAPDASTLLVPDRPGNGLTDGHLNILENPKIGLIFFIPNTRESLRVSGTAELFFDEEQAEALSARGKPALLITKVTVEQVFFHCGKALIRSQLWQPEHWPEAGRVSFGAAFAKREGKTGLAGKALTKLVDVAIERDYKKNL